MNRLLSILPLLILPLLASSQQLPLFTQYRSNQGIINPASINCDYFAFSQNLAFGAAYRSQWSGLDGAPATQSLWGEYFMQQTGGVSLLTGGYLLNDRTGPTGFTGLYGRIGGVLVDRPEYGGLAFGLNLGVVQYRVDGSQLRLRDQGDMVAAENYNQWVPDVGLGVFGYKMLDGGFFDDDYVFAGISVPQVIGLNLKFESDQGTFETQRVQHIYAQAGLYHFFDDESFLETSLWAKYAPNAPLNADLNLRYQMQSSFWAGVGVSTAGIVHLEAGFLLGQNLGFDRTLRIGYGFDTSVSSFGPFVGPTHELNLNFSLER
jgi:type IX secretion system PorP/SprF family membrane protein